MCFGIKERESLYSNGGRNMNGMPFNLIKNHEPKPYFSLEENLVH